MATYIFIHGLGQSPLSWDKTISYMSDSDHSHSPDLLMLVNGKEVTYTNLYAAFSEYCDKCSEQLRLCGISLGAILALNYALDHPQKVQSLILIGAQYKMPKRLLRIQNAIFRLMPERAFGKMGFGRNAMIALTTSMMELDFSDRLKDISYPVLVICGEKDRANQKASEELAQIILHSEYQCIPDAGHEVNVDAPKELAGLLVRYGKEAYIK